MGFQAVCTLNYMKENDQDLAKVKQFNLREAVGNEYLLSCQKYKSLRVGPWNGASL